MKAAHERKPVDETKQEQTKKKAYAAPKLKNYGTIAKLTQGGGGNLGESGRFSMVPCL